jgi:TonB family protein
VTTTTDPRRAGGHVRLVRPASCAPGGPRSVAGRRRRDRRRAQRGRVAPLGVETAAAARASLGAAGAGHDGRWAGVLVCVLALTAHAVIAVAVWRTPAAILVARTSTRITVQVHDAPPPLLAPRPKVPAPLAPVAPARSAPWVVHVQTSRSPRPPEPTAAQAPAPVKMVGLSLESTSEAGGGPAFAVGDTLAGTTALTAPRTPPAAADPSPGPNRVARGAPRPGSVLTPPRRLREVKPHYPDARRAAGVEADVLLVVSLDAAGTVLSVTVGRSSGDAAFDESARTAARQERFGPALRDGVPVPTTFTFTTRFRLDTP